MLVAYVTISSYHNIIMGMEKDLARMKRHPEGVRFEELERIVLRSGFKRVNIRGSHHVYKKGNKVLTVVRPHGRQKDCHWLDVKDVIRFLEED